MKEDVTMSNGDAQKRTAHADLHNALSDQHQRLPALVQRVEHHRDRRTERPYHADDNPRSKPPDAIHRVREEQRKRDDDEGRYIVYLVLFLSSWAGSCVD